MGLFSAIGNTIKAVGTALVNGAKAVVSTVKSWFSDTKETARDNAMEISEMDEYDSDTASARDTDILSEILSRMSVKYKDQARNLEDDVSDLIEKHFDEIIDELDENDFDTGFIKEEKRKIRKKVRNSITSKISERMALSDYECEEILRMPTGKRKQQRMEEFGYSVIDEAMDEFGEKIKRSCKNVEKEIENTVQKRMKEKETELRTKAEEINDMIARLDEGTFDSESDSVEPNNNIFVCSYLMDLLNVK